MQVLIREMQPAEKDDVEELFSRSLGLVDRIFFLISFEGALKGAQKQRGGSLVAECDGRVVGSVSMRLQRVGAKRIGFVDALVTDVTLRGKGIGGSLVDGAISWLEARKCEEIFVTADRYNSPSWSLFVHRGFGVYEFSQQLRDYRWSFIRLWLGEFHFIGYGTFFLRRGREEAKPWEIGEAWHFLAAWLGAGLVWWIPALWGGQSLVLLPLLLAVVGISLFVHELSQRLVGYRLGLETTFKAWESGILLGLFLAVIGSFFPIHGSTYVKQVDWWYELKKRKTGIIFAVGPFVSLALAYLFRVLSSLTPSDLLAATGRVGYMMNLVTVIFHLIPVQAAGGFVWDGKKILIWNKSIWLILFAGTVALILIDVRIS